jgi:uncharacterized protein YgbK (DUF1537 family)
MGDADADSGPDLLCTFYGDDFTGSTDVLEALALNGARGVLFFEPPDPADLDAFEGVDAVGVAGRSRAMSPAEMDAHLPGAFEALAAFDAPLCHYKVCSTFDSSPTVGSVGRAVDLGQAVFDGPFVPVVVAAPELAPRGRYVVFGNLFATVDGETHRLDRHPTMADHPVTPMSEADLRRHLGEQTDRERALLDVRALGGDPDAPGPERALAAAREDGEVVVCDGLTREHQRTVGRLVWERAREEGPLFSASSSGLTYALGAHWREAGVVDAGERVNPPPAPAVDRIAVVSGSASPATDAQIGWALANGFEGIRLDTAALVDPDRAPAVRDAAVEAAVAALDRGDSVVLYSARGPDDPAIEATRERAADLGLDGRDLGERLGRQQGRILRAVVAGADLGRACVAGGDTSGHVAPELDVYALEYRAPVGPGSPLCTARAEGRFDGLELALKGGQVETRSGEPDFFGAVRAGGPPGDGE